MRIAVAVWEQHSGRAYLYSEICKKILAMHAVEVLDLWIVYIWIDSSVADCSFTAWNIAKPKRINLFSDFRYFKVET